MKGDYLSMLIPLARKTKYPPDAFYFIKRGLDFTVRRIHGSTPEDQASHLHVSCKQLCLGLRDYGLEQYGELAQTVLKRWNITRCDDFGHIVFAMVDAELIRKTEEDTLKDFQGVFSFDDAFAYEILLEAPGKDE
jgi:uncharacterized repeat protein (TIGR04138 family)